eukprot:comp22463_c0_seq2/m.55388 comp22463_c0_seq2/g.55388  ORF comp22463_c0_seq2/g.55388 comp22463_c0_seq2/m.55388 type:complete len:309 (-) comp22463_c0_seq2:1487-2413(-)
MRMSRRSTSPMCAAPHHAQWSQTEAETWDSPQRLPWGSLPARTLLLWPARLRTPHSRFSTQCSSFAPSRSTLPPPRSTISCPTSAQSLVARWSPWSEQTWASAPQILIACKSELQTAPMWLGSLRPLSNAPQVQLLQLGPRQSSCPSSKPTSLQKAQMPYSPTFQQQFPWSSASCRSSRRALLGANAPQSPSRAPTSPPTLPTFAPSQSPVAPRCPVAHGPGSRLPRSPALPLHCRSHCRACPADRWLLPRGRAQTSQQPALCTLLPFRRCTISPRASWQWHRRRRSSQSRASSSTVPVSVSNPHRSQ